MSHTYPHDDDRDTERSHWNAALASGDPNYIEATRDMVLMRIHTRIMSDDPNYAEAGWGIRR